MQFLDVGLPGAWLIQMEPRPDERGFFARSFCEAEFSGAGLCSRFPQHSVSYNRQRGTVRGMHFQAEPHGETKVVRCVAGAVHDVIVDLRPESSTYRRCVGVELSAENRHALYIPKGFAHGFQTLRDDSELLYMIDVGYVADAARGIRWDDPSFDIAWLEPVSIISPRDMAFPDWPA